MLERVRGVLAAAGFDEAMTLSAVDEAWVDAIRPWTDAAAAADLDARAAAGRLPAADACCRACSPPGGTTKRLANPVIELFEIANVYLPIAGGAAAAEAAAGDHQRRRISWS